MGVDGVGEEDRGTEAGVGEAASEEVEGGRVGRVSGHLEAARPLVTILMHARITPTISFFSPYSATYMPAESKL
ncbi:hypothetical protein B296_00034914 [Ensete ventricosum]|uniref:Uncharacterized protein n=1 Tax=Ensete ventricosum TaxID=4639 RepID=A0A426X9E1_ENSVE|nr:hypothetical protein B296_00034914 [Ensete ventricosum]